MFSLHLRLCEGVRSPGAGETDSCGLPGVELESSEWLSGSGYGTGQGKTEKPLFTDPIVGIGGV